MRDGADDAACVQHAGQLDVEGVPRLASDFLHGIERGTGVPIDVQLAFSASGGGSSAGTCRVTSLEAIADDAVQQLWSGRGCDFESAVIARLPSGRRLRLTSHALLARPPRAWL